MFNIAMHGDMEEELDGTELSAEFSFSSLQKFGQEFLMKLRGKKMPNPLLKKVRYKKMNLVSALKTLKKMWNLCIHNAWQAASGVVATQGKRFLVFSSSLLGVVICT